MTPQELKNSILQLAIQGKLVEQRPEEGTAEELYKQIQAEKQALIKAGKIKKEKPLPEITEDEIPFDIPETWKWVRLGQFCADIFSGKSPVYSKEKTDFRIIGQAANQQNGLDMSQIKYTNSVFWNLMEERYFLRENDVLLNTLGNGTLGRSGFINNLSYPLLTDGHLFVFRTIDVLSSKYLYYFLQYKRRDIEKTANGSTNQTFLSLSRTVNWIIPLPPLAEQKRIVASIEELLPLIDRYEKAWDRLEDFNKRFPGDMQKSILQMAIQGKLVEQCPEEGTGEELYQQIQKEKQALIKAGKIKKEKPLPEITEDEIPFDIPESWKWVRFGELFALSNGTASRGTPGGQKRPVLRLADISANDININNIREITLSEKEFNSHMLKTNDLVFIRVNGSRERVATAYLYTDSETISYCDHLFCGHRLSDGVFSLFIMLMFNCESTRIQLRPEIKTTAGQNTISQASMAKILIPLPPLAEQKRIVARLEELLPLCERLK